MAYQVIARKYRPQRFKDVVGQDHVTQTLEHAIEQGRVAHAYLFCGPRGTGKTTLARIFAKCLNCEGGPSVQFEDSDQRCREIAEGRSLDVLEIDGASNRGVEEIRELRETVQYAPTAAPYKIYIIDEVHMLTKEAFNALLKTLEEPPKHVIFMFATTEQNKVLPTILSRCQRFALRRIPLQLIADHLAYIAKEEGVEIETEALRAIARAAAGGMRDAESSLDQLISFCGSRIQEKDVLHLFGMTSPEQLWQLAQSLVAGETWPALRLVDELIQEGKELEYLLGDLLSFFRGLMLHQLSGQNEETLAVSEAEMNVYRSLSGRITPGQLNRVIETLSDCDCRLRYASAKRIFLEMALVKAVEAIRAVPLDEVLSQLSGLQQSQEGRSPAVQPKPIAPDPPASESDATETRPAGSGSVAAKAAEDWKQWWPKIAAHLKEKTGGDYGYLDSPGGLEYDGRVLTIGGAGRVPEHVASIGRALSEAGKECREIRFLFAPEPNPTPDPEGATSEEASAPAVEADPVPQPEETEPTVAAHRELIAKAQTMYKAQVVGSERRQ